MTPYKFRNHVIAKVFCATLMGIDAFKIILEVDSSRSGTSCFTMVGLAEGVVKARKLRIYRLLKPTTQD